MAGGGAVRYRQGGVLLVLGGWYGDGRMGGARRRFRLRHPRLLENGCRRVGRQRAEQFCLLIY